jgi:hypothetical protein
LTLPDGEDWLLRPVKRSCIKYESLIDCTLSLFDIALLNDFLDVCDENEYRYDDGMKE